MFQNITRDSNDNTEFYDEEIKKVNTKDVLKRLFAKQNIVLYIVTFMISMVGFDNNSLIFSLVPFGLAIIVAALSNDRPIGIMYILSLIGTYISFGFTNLLVYFITSLLLFISILLIRPRLQENVNEKKKIGGHLFFSVLIVQIVPMFFRTFYVFDLMTSIMLGMTTYIFYKIFVNSITVIVDFGKRRAFTIEEVIGTSLLLAIAITAFGDLSIFGFSIKNILSALIVLVLGWKNGLLVGATGGITIGVVLGVITESEPIMIAVYAVSGLIAGLLNRFGRIGVIVGFALGNVVLAYAANGNTAPLIVFQEILIAVLGLLAVPKNIEINIEDLVGNTRLLPESTGGNLETNQDTIYKLNSISDTIYDMAESYREAAATILTEDELKEQEKKNIDKITNVNFRDKKYGWHNFVLKIQNKNNTIYNKSERDNFYKIFFDNILLNPSCRECELRKKKSSADIRLGDFWGEIYENDYKGVSAILILSNKGKMIINKISNNIEIIKKENLEEMLKYQSTKNYRNAQLYEEAMKTLKNNAELKKVIKLYRNKLGKKYRIKQNLKVLGAFLPNNVKTKLKKVYKGMN